MSIKIKNGQAFNAKNRKWLNAVRREVERSAVNLVIFMHEYIVKESPQFSGDFVRGWYWGVAPQSPFGDDNFFKAATAGIIQPHKKGDADPIRQGISEVKLTAPRNYKLGEPLRLMNTATHDEPYAWAIEAGTIKFRPVNPNSSRVVARATEQVKARFSKLDKFRYGILSSEYTPFV